VALVQYVTIPGAPGKYFECKPFRATLSTERCASMWKAKREQCLYCPIGAGHAGAPARMKAVGQCTCSRCHSDASRLMASGVCVSCYNREREVAVGRNGKGVPPRPQEVFWNTNDDIVLTKTVVVHRLSFGVIASSRRSARLAQANAADTIEAMINVLRKDHGAAFMRRMPTATRQLSLFCGI
jgi:hypothetical protein